MRAPLQIDAQLASPHRRRQASLRHSQANGELNMGRFDSRNTTKMRRRRAQEKKKARAERRAEEVRAERKGGKKS